MLLSGGEVMGEEGRERKVLGSIPLLAPFEAARATDFLRFLMLFALDSAGELCPLLI
jgi:hypothetical protein